MAVRWLPPEEQHLWHANMPIVRERNPMHLRWPMEQDRPNSTRDTPALAERKPLSPAAQRALAEAEARRAARSAESPLAVEFQGPKGPEPTRYGDWENKGIASDF